MAKKFSVIVLAVVALGFVFVQSSNADDSGVVQEPAPASPAPAPSYNYAPPPPIYYAPPAAVYYAPPPVRVVVYPSIGFYPAVYGFGFHRHHYSYGARVVHRRPYHWR